ncbi:hypothetical protein E2562_035030, partial [Oryza meyeriana var. granulata]
FEHFLSSAEILFLNQTHPYMQLQSHWPYGNPRIFVVTNGDVDNNVCMACPPHSGMVHPHIGGFICGASKDQKIFKVPFS